MTMDTDPEEDWWLDGIIPWCPRIAGDVQFSFEVEIVYLRRILL